jgi:hypothetical protein
MSSLHVNEQHETGYVDAYVSDVLRCLVSSLQSVQAKTSHTIGSLPSVALYKHPVHLTTDCAFANPLKVANYFSHESACVVLLQQRVRV